jgi:hypothetical protein
MVQVYDASFLFDGKSKTARREHEAGLGGAWPTGPIQTALQRSRHNTTSAHYPHFIQSQPEKSQLKGEGNGVDVIVGAVINSGTLPGEAS